MRFALATQTTTFFADKSYSTTQRG